MKRSRLLGVAILVAVTVLVTALWVNEGPLWRMVMLRRTEEVVRAATEGPLQRILVVRYDNRWTRC